MDSFNPHFFVMFPAAEPDIATSMKPLSTGAGDDATGATATALSTLSIYPSMGGDRRGEPRALKICFRGFVAEVYSRLAFSTVGEGAHWGSKWVEDGFGPVALGSGWG